MARKVIVQQHDPRWAELFATEARLVNAALGTTALAIHHIGSTAIAGIAAKPIVDILVEASSLAALDACQEQMVSLGYEAMGEFGISDRRYFRKDDATGTRTHQVHAFPHGSDQIRRHLAFRDFMRAHPAWAAKYSQLKIDSASRYPDSMESYIDSKDAFIKHVDHLAARWHAKL